MHAGGHLGLWMNLEAPPQSSRTSPSKAFHCRQQRRPHETLMMHARMHSCLVGQLCFPQLPKHTCCAGACVSQSKLGVF